MAHHPRCLNLLLSAMIALVGLVSAPGLAAACSGSTRAVSAMPCCKSMPAKDCNCCDREPGPATPAPVDLAVSSIRPVAPSTSITLAAPEHCGCRLEAPSTPAHRSDSRSEGGGERPESCPRTVASVLAAVVATPPSAPYPGLTPGASLGRSPVYLRTSRLLI